VDLDEAKIDQVWYLAGSYGGSATWWDSALFGSRHKVDVLADPQMLYIERRAAR
jgi:hypothetical protein